MDIANLSIPPDIWYIICLNLSVKSLYMLRSTCKGLRRIVADRSIWFAVFMDLLCIKPSVYSREDLERMTASQLREASQRMVRVDRAFSCPTIPHRETQIMASTSLSKYADLVIFPGGERILVLNRNGAFDIHDVPSGNRVFAVPRIEGIPINKCFVRLYPSSIDTGHILIYASVVLEGVEDQWPSRVNSQEFRIYHYTQQEVRHVWTEECPRKMADGSFFLFHTEATLCLTQLYHWQHPDATGKGALVEVHNQKLEANRRSAKEILTFYLEESSESYCDMILLSPRYLSYRLENEDNIRLIDMFQARNHVDKEPRILHSIWRSPKGLEFNGGPHRVVPLTALRWAAGRTPFVRAIVHTRIIPMAFVLELPALDDIPEPASCIRFLPIPPVEFAPVSPGPFNVEVYQYPCALFNYGFLSYRVRYLFYPRSPPMYNIYPFAIARSPGSEDNESTPGLLRLDRKFRSEHGIVLGNTKDSCTQSTIAQRFLRCRNETYVDDVSGRFVQLVSEDDQLKVVLYRIEGL